MRIKRVVWSVVLLAASAILAPTAVLYADIKIINGSACVNAAGGWANVEYSSGRARQTGVTDVTLICPIVRDVIESFPVATVDGRVNVTDANSGDGLVSCVLTCCDTAGIGCETSTKNSVTDGIGNTTLNFDPIDPDGTAEPCTIKCDLRGANDRLRWYEYTE